MVKFSTVHSQSCLVNTLYNSFKILSYNSGRSSDVINSEYLHGGRYKTSMKILGWKIGVCSFFSSARRVREPQTSGSYLNIPGRTRSIRARKRQHRNDDTGRIGQPSNILDERQAKLNQIAKAIDYVLMCRLRR